MTRGPGDGSCSHTGVGFGVGQERTGMNRRREGRRQTTFVELTAEGCVSVMAHTDGCVAVVKQCWSH